MNITEQKRLVLAFGRWLAVLGVQRRLEQGVLRPQLENLLQRLQAVQAPNALYDPVVDTIRALVIGDDPLSAVRELDQLALRLDEQWRSMGDLEDVVEALASVEFDAEARLSLELDEWSGDDDG